MIRRMQWVAVLVLGLVLPGSVPEAPAAADTDRPYVAASSAGDADYAGRAYRRWVEILCRDSRSCLC